MFSPFRRHQQQARAARAAANAGQSDTAIAAPMPADGAASVEYRALLAVLHDHLRALSEIQSVEARNPRKAEMARDFDAWVDGVLAAGREGRAAQDEILVTMLVWAIDCRAIDRAIELGEHALTHGLQLPDRYKRSVACLLAEDIAEATLADPAAASMAQLVQVAELTEAADMPDQARAKLFKALGRAASAAAASFDPQSDDAVAGGKPALLTAAAGWYQRAIKLNRSIGVKKDLEAAERELKALADTAQANAT